jgi:ClpP class serine protease
VGTVPEPTAPTLAATEIDPARILAMLERTLAERPVLLMRPDAAISLGGHLASRASGFGEEPAPSYETSDDVAILSIEGPLYQRAVSICGFALADGYDAIADRARAAFNDGAIGAVVAAIDSPGGDAAGVLELADDLARMSAESGKPLVTYGAESAASAAYWLGCAASSIVVPRSGELGSIGAIVMGINQAGALEKAGLRAVVAAYPSGKAAGWNAMLSPPDSAEALAGLAKMSERAETIARLFAGDVAQRRNMTLENVLALDAAMFTGSRAVDVGLADLVGGRAAAVSLARSKIKRKVYSMAGNQTDAQSRAAKALLPLLAIGGLDLQTTAEQPPERLEAAAVEAERLASLGKAVEALTGQKGAAALALVKAQRELAAEVPRLEARVKVEALRGRLSQKIPPAAAFALDAAGLPDAAAGPSEIYATMSLEVFDVKTSSAGIHPAASGPPTPAPADNQARWRAEAIAKGKDPDIYIAARRNIAGATS